MAETILPGAIHRGTEFVRGLTGACGPNALAMGSAWSTQADVVDTGQVYDWMRARGLCQLSGASTIDELKQAVAGLGFTIPEYRGYGEPWADWHAWYTRHVGVSYILMETARGQALVDAISGRGENAVNLQYHFIGVVGHHDGGFSPRAGRDLPAGWWCVDGDNFAAGDVLQFYPDSLMIAAQPCAALTIAAKVEPHMAWHRNADGTATDDAGHHVGQGFATLVLSKYAQTNGRTGEVYYDTGKSFALLNTGTVLNWNQQTGVHDDKPADVVAEVDQIRTTAMQQLQAANASLGDLKAQLQTAQVSLADTKRELDNTKAQLATCEATPHDNPLADEALAVAKAQKALEGKLP